MKKLAFSVLAAVLFFSACKKDEKDDAKETPRGPESYYKFNDTTTALFHGYLEKDGDGINIVITDSALSKTYSGPINAISLDLDTLIDNNTYTFMERDSAAFDKKVNFRGAYTLSKGKVADGEVDDEIPGARFFDDGIKSGTVKVRKNGESYTVEFEVVYPKTTVTGRYVGKLPPLQI